jgi:hypothetical protein
VGGYEHYARAIIPFLMEELKVTGISQVFISVEKKTEFMMQLKLILVSRQCKKNSLNKLIHLLEGRKGIDILSVIPPRLYHKETEVNIMNLKINLAWFISIDAIFQTIKNILKSIYNKIRDFDEGLRDRDMHSLLDLTAELAAVHPLIIKEIYFNFDEIYRMETPAKIMAEIINLACATIKVAKKEEMGQVVVNYKNINHPLKDEALKTIFIIAYGKDIKILSKFINNLPGIEVYFTRIEWEQRFYLILILKKNNRALIPAEINKIKTNVLNKYLKNALVIDSNNQAAADHY